MKCACLRDARQYVLLHAQDDGLTALREAGLKYERQQRLYSELGAVDALNGTANVQPENSDLPQCCICQKSMNHRTEELMALECSHVFHVTCITECWTKLGKPQWIRHPSRRPDDGFKFVGAASCLELHDGDPGVANTAGQVMFTQGIFGNDPFHH